MSISPQRYDGGPIFDKDGRPIPPSEKGCGCLVFSLIALLLGIIIWYAYQ